jgi:hypothetical protein
MADRLISREDANADVLTAAAFIGERIASSDGRSEAMTAIVPRLLERDKVDLAAALADTIDDPYSRDRLLISVAERCIDIGDDEYALQLADAVEEDAMRSQAFENVAIKMAAKGDTAAARGLSESVAHPDFLNAAIAVREASDGDDQASAATIQSIEFANARVAAYKEMAAAAYSSGADERAVEYLNLAIDAAGEIEHDEEKIRSLCEVAGLFSDAKREDRAAETYLIARAEAEQLDNIHREYFLAACAIGLMRSGDEDKAEETLDLITDKTQMATALYSRSREEWRRDDKQAAVESLDEAYDILKSQHERETRDTRAKNLLMSRIAVQYAAFGNAEKAVEIAEEHTDIDEQISALSQVASVQAVRGELEAVRQTLGRIPDEGGRLMAMVGVIDELNKREHGAEALALLDEVAETAAAIDRPLAQSQVLNEAAARYLAAGMPEKARRVSLENLSVIATIRDESNRAAALAAMSDIYAAGRLELLDDEKELLTAMTAKMAWA